MNEKRQEDRASILIMDEQGTAALGKRIAGTLVRGSVVSLQGDLGAGKTTLARAILRALGVAEPVPSPTFLLVQRYDTAVLSVWHFDFYRIESSREVEELGLDEALMEGAVLVEWPERAAALLPIERLSIELEVVGDNARRVNLHGPAKILKALGENFTHVH